MQKAQPVNVRDAPAASTPKTEQDVDMLSDKWLRDWMPDQAWDVEDDITNIGEEEDVYALAKSYVDCREFERAAYHLRNCHHAKSVFLRIYSKYMV